MAEKDRGGGIKGSRGKWGRGPGAAEESGARVSRIKWGRVPGAAEERKGEGETEGDPVLKDRGVQEQRRILGGSEVE